LQESLAIKTRRAKSAFAIIRLKREVATVVCALSLTRSGKVAFSELFSLSDKSSSSVKSFAAFSADSVQGKASAQDNMLAAQTDNRHTCSCLEVKFRMLDNR
jgi:hypothetical protein